MNRTRRLSPALALLASVCVAMLALPASAGAVSVDKLERKELWHINKFRKQHHLRKLVMDRRLTKDAEWMAHDMPSYNYFAHVDHLSRDPFTRLVAFHYPSNTWRGENLAAGYADPKNTFVQWKNSPEHRANMLTGQYRAIGISRVCMPGSTYRCYWVTEFGSKVVARVK